MKKSNIEFKVNLNGIEAITRFSKACCEYDGDIDLVSGRYVVDGKSILGLFSLDLSKQITCIIYDNGNEESIKDIQNSLSEFKVA